MYVMVIMINRELYKITGEAVKSGLVPLFSFILL
jgi:hypothetical protein